MERNGKKLRLLNEDQAHDAVVDLISEIKLITGATVYQGDMLKAQLEVIKRFLLSGFSMLTKEELVEAFYMNLQGTFDEVYVHYNKELNAEFIGNVIRAYLRWKAAFLKENKKTIQSVLLPAAKPEKRVVDYDFWKEQVQKDLMFVNHQALEATLWHSRKYVALRRFGMMPFKGTITWFYFLKQALSTGKYKLKIPSGADIRMFKFTSTNQVVKLFEFSEDYHRCVEEARKYAYWHVLTACKECGIRNIWSEVQSNGHA